MKQIELRIKKTIQNNLNEIRRLENSVILKWREKLNGLKNETYNHIQNATEAQLRQLNQLLGDIQTQVNNFL